VTDKPRVFEIPAPGDVISSQSGTWRVLRRRDNPVNGVVALRLDGPGYGGRAFTWHVRPGEGKGSWTFKSRAEWRPKDLLPMSAVET
jgi:hypothetical protein